MLPTTKGGFRFALVGLARANGAATPIVTVLATGSLKPRRPTK